MHENNRNYCTNYRQQGEITLEKNLGLTDKFSYDYRRLK